ncbi:hypothetical protein CPLU01_06715 [Colletotrichum plurivorum]|uniref:Uncharacterized protein n=1 Tax=Colletotrichum plurivorum TaxID=2175906 RepID=A0A8H6KHA9_9PEZI|nr:hypothetical protein CPLU01_06715 [Colletotrichum plurivorum]
MSESSTSPMKGTVAGGKVVPETTPTAQNVASATTKIADESTSEVATEVAIKPAKEAQVEVRDEDTKNLATASATMLKTGEFMKSLMAQCVACDSMNETGHIETETIVFKPTVNPITESEPMEEVLPSEDKAEATMTEPPEAEIPAPTHASKSPAKNEGNTPSWEDTLLQLESIKAVDLLEEERDIFRAFAYQDNEEVADWVWMCWEVMFNIVQSPDVASGVLDRLVSIIESLHRRARGNVKVDGKDKRLWKDMPLFADAMETYLADPTTGYMKFTEEAAQAWQNMNSFAARGLAGSIGGPFNQAMTCWSALMVRAGQRSRDEGTQLAVIPTIWAGFLSPSSESACLPGSSPGTRHQKGSIAGAHKRSLRNLFCGTTMCFGLESAAPRSRIAARVDKIALDYWFYASRLSGDKWLEIGWRCWLHWARYRAPTVDPSLRQKQGRFD